MQNQLTPLTRYWLRLSLVRGRTPAFWLALLNHYNLTIEALFALSADKLMSLGLKAHDVNQLASVSSDVDKVSLWLSDNPQNQIIAYPEQTYPARLRQLDSPPLVLFCCGDTGLLHGPQVAIVGSRKATIQGLNTARQFGRELGEAGITVTSGLALGIDGAAHQGAYPTLGRTVAVLGGGLTKIYPRSHRALAANIIQCNGCLASEFMPWENVKPYHFPRRNRLIAALSSGVLLIEAKIKSGSMITANLAADLGIDVFATPGNINNPLSEGPHYLIQQGAKLVTCVADICEEIGGLPNALSASASQTELDNTQSDPLLKEFAGEPIDINYLVAKTGLPVSALMPRLMALEIKGIVLTVPGGYVRA